MEGLIPVMVAAAKDGVWNIGKFLSLETLHPAAEGGCVVRRLTFVRGRDDDDRPVCGEGFGCCVQWFHDGSCESVRCRACCQDLGKTLAGARVGPVKDAHGLRRFLV